MELIARLVHNCTVITQVLAELSHTVWQAITQDCVHTVLVLQETNGVLYTLSIETYMDIVW